MLCWLLSGLECTVFTGANRLQRLCHADQYAQAIAKLIACDNRRETIKLGRERISLGQRSTVNMVCVCMCKRERERDDVSQDRKWNLDGNIGFRSSHLNPIYGDGLHHLPPGPPGPSSRSSRTYMEAVFTSMGPFWSHTVHRDPDRLT